MKWFPRSIRWRIQAWHGALLLLVLTGFGITAARLQRTNEYRRLDSELAARVNALSAALTRAPGPPRPPPGPGEEPRGARPPHHFSLPPDFEGFFAPTPEGQYYYYVLWTREDEPLGQSETAPPGVTLPARTGTEGVRSRDGFREAWHFTPPGECLLAGISETGITSEMNHFRAELTALGGAVLALGLAIGAWISSRAIRPIENISTAATRIAAGHLDERITVAENGSELDRLAAVLNDTFSRLEAAFAEQARFTSDAAHELRTPLSVILAQSQLALSRNRSVEEYRETIAMTQRAAQRMHGLVESLLALATLDAHSEPLQPQPCDLAEVAREQLDLIQPLANERRVTLHPDLTSTPCTADPTRIGQILTNLLANAVKYSDPDDEVRVTTHRENGHAIVRVTDTGPGIAAEHLPHLFERFYRADSSRNRTTGGAGLGLAICRALSESHGGTLEVTSTLGEGTTFTLRLPATLPTSAASSPYR